MLGEVGHTEPQGHCWFFCNGSFGTSTVVLGWYLTSRGSYKSDGLKEDGTDTPSHCFLKADLLNQFLSLFQSIIIQVRIHRLPWLGRRLLQPTLQQYTEAEQRIKPSALWTF